MTEIDKIFKTCTSCKKELELEKFSLLNSEAGTRNSHCKSCRNKKGKITKHERKKEGTKKCQECQRELDVKDFYANKLISDGLQSYCKDCKIGQMQKSTTKLNSYINYLYLGIKHNNKKRSKDLSFEITKEDIHDLYIRQNGKCVYTGIILTTIRYTVRKDQRQQYQHIMNKYNISVDRIDSNKGYIKDNIQLVCAIINSMKNDLTEDEFLLLCNNISNSNKDRIELLKNNKLIN